MRCASQALFSCSPGFGANAVIAGQDFSSFVSLPVANGVAWTKIFARWEARGIKMN
jgi:hypothetical protein